MRTHLAAGFRANKLIRALLALVASVVVAGVSTAQRTWIVDATLQPGANFATIQAAVDAAAPGDTIRVRPGSAYAGATIGKGVYLVGEQRITLYSDLVVTGLPAAEHVTIASFKFDYNTTTSGARPIVVGNAGTVHFEDVRSTGSVRGPAITIDGCAQVSLVDCVMDAGYTSYWLSGTYRNIGGDIGIQCTNSALSVVRTQARGAMAWVEPYAMTFLGSWAGIELDGTRAVFVDSVVTGGDGACLLSGTFCFPKGPATGAVITKGTTSITTKGTRFTGGVYSPCPCGTPPPDIQAGGNTTVTADPGVAFTVTGGRIVTQTIADLQGNRAAPGTVLTLTLRRPGTSAFTTFAGFAGPPVPVLPPLGVWLEPALLIPVASGVVQAVRSDKLSVPASFSVGLPVAFQSMLLHNGAIELSTPILVVL